MKTVTFGGRDFVLDDLPFGTVKVVIPLINKLVPMAAKQEFTQEFFENFALALLAAATPTNEGVTMEMINGLKPKIKEMGQVLGAILECSGLELTQKKDTAEGKEPAAAP